MPLDAGELANVVAKTTEARDRANEALSLLAAEPINQPTQVTLKLYLAYVHAEEAMEAFIQDWKD